MKCRADLAVAGSPSTTEVPSGGESIENVTQKGELEAGGIADADGCLEAGAGRKGLDGYATKRARGVVSVDTWRLPEGGSVISEVGEGLFG